MQRPFQQVDVFTETSYLGNPVAVVLDAEGVSEEEMAGFSAWTNLSEATFVLPPTDEGADYRVRIYSGSAELPFAGHPTLGTCHAWLSAGGRPARAEEIVQECAVGLVRVRRVSSRLSFAAPDLVRSGELDDTLVDRVAGMLGIRREEIVASSWVDNGPGWVGILLETPEAVLSLEPTGVEMPVGVVAPYPPGSEHAFEVRAFFPKDGATAEDPVTGSLNASLAMWLLSTGRATPPYVARQGTALGRAGRVHVSQDPDGTIWVGGGTRTCISGTVEL